MDAFEKTFIIASMLCPSSCPRYESAEMISRCWSKHSSKNTTVAFRRNQHRDPEAMDALMRYEWPGNIRELENVIERGILFAETTELTPSDLSEQIQRRAT